MGGERERNPTSAGSAPTGSRDSVAHETPAQKAADAASVSARQLSGVERLIDDVETISDPGIWSQKHGEAKRQLADAAKTIERARRLATTAEAASLDSQAAQLERATQRLENTTAPRGFADISREAELRAIVDAPLVGGAKAGNDKKEADLATLFRGLDPRESRAFSQRLTKNAPTDPVATAIGRLTPDRQQRLKAVLAGADRRQAQLREGERREHAARAAEVSEPVAVSPTHESANATEATQVSDVNSASAKHPVGEGPTISAQPTHAVFAVTEVKRASPLISVIFTNPSAETVTVESIAIDPGSVKSADRYPELELVTQLPSQLPLPPGTPIVVQLRFHPTKPGPIGAKLRLRGHSPSGAVHAYCEIIGESVNAGSSRADQRELELGKHQARHLDESREVPVTNTFIEMLSSVLAAESATNTNGEEGRHRAQRLLEPVLNRMDELAPTAPEKLERFGAGNIAGKAIFDGAKGAVDSWIRRIKLGSSVEAASLVTRFRAGAEAIHILTGERTEAPGLDGFDKATKAVGLGASAILAGPLGAIVVEEVGLLVATAKMAGVAAGAWAVANPVAALAAVEALIGFGVQIGEDGLANFMDTLGSTRGALFVVMQIVMDVMHVSAGLEGSGGARSPRPNARPDATPGSTVAPNEVAEVRRRFDGARAVVESVGEQAASKAPGRATGPQSLDSNPSHERSTAQHPSDGTAGEAKPQSSQGQAAGHEASNAVESERHPIQSRKQSGPAEIHHGYGKLSARQSKLLEQMPKPLSRIVVKKSDVNITDLATLTAQTGDEFAVFTRGSQRLIVRGNKTGVPLDVQELTELRDAGYRWSGHTHPNVTDLVLDASSGDRMVLKIFNQEKSLIANGRGARNVFDADNNQRVK